MKKLSGNRTLYKYVCEFVCVFSEFGFTNLKIMTSMAKNCIVKIRNWKRKSKHEGLHLSVNSYVELYLVEILKQLCGPWKWDDKSINHKVFIFDIYHSIREDAVKILGNYLKDIDSKMIKEREGDGA